MATKPTRKRATKKTEEVVEKVEVQETVEQPEEAEVIKELEVTEKAETTEEVVVEKPEAVEPAEEVKEVEETKPTTNAEVKLNTVDDVKAYLKLPKVDAKVKLETLAKEGPTVIKSLVGPMLTFSKEMGQGSPELKPEQTLAKIYNLFTVIKSAITTEDNNLFVVKMDIINLVFKEFGKLGEAYYPTNLLRYDYLWSWGESSKTTHQILTVIISDLADKSTRAAKLKTISFDNEFSRNGLALPQDKIERLVRYYTA